MKNIKQNILIGIVILLMTSCGTLGHIQFYAFDKSKVEVEKDLLNIIDKDSMYTAPKGWNDYELGADSIRDVFIMFPSNPKEIFQVGFVGPSSEWEGKATSTLALVGVFDGKLWHFEKDLNSDEEARLMKRFETEILSKMKYQYSKE